MESGIKGEAFDDHEITPIGHEPDGGGNDVPDGFDLLRRGHVENPFRFGADAFPAKSLIEQNRERDAFDCALGSFGAADGAAGLIVGAFGFAAGAALRGSGPRGGTREIARGSGDATRERDATRVFGLLLGSDNGLFRIVDFFARLATGHVAIDGDASTILLFAEQRSKGRVDFGEHVLFDFLTVFEQDLGIFFFG